MANLTRSVPEIVGFLRSRCGLKDLRLDPQLTNVEFDAVLIGADPLSVVAVEHKDTTSTHALQQSIRKAQSFVWSMYTNSKLALLNLVLLVPEDLQPDALNDFQKELSGVARMFVISEQMSIDEVERRLSLLANPQLATKSRSSTTADLKSLLSGIPSAPYEELASKSRSAEELQSKLQDVFQSLLSEVEHAVEQS